MFFGEKFNFFKRTIFIRGNFTRKISAVTLGFMFALSACNSENSQTGAISSTNGNINPPKNPASSSNPAPITTGNHAWKMQDVSVLFPIPDALPNANAIHPTQSGAMGEFIPASLLAKLPLLEPNLALDTEASQLELVSVRFDPPEQQIRLIWQVFKPIVNPDGTHAIVAFDTAVHAFYQMNDVNSFLHDLNALVAFSAKDSNAKDSNSQTPLGVHPTLAREGMSGEYATALNALISKYCGEKTIFRMTFMQASGEHLHWTFGGFTYTNGVVANFMIPKINIDTTQTYTNSSPSAMGFVGGIDVAPSGQNEFDAILTNSSSATAVTSMNLELAHFTSVTLENPNLSPTTATDCASCHAAQMEKLFIEAQVPGTATEPANVFTAPDFNLTNGSPDINRSDNLHSFGYFAGTPSVSQRTINESASIAQYLNQLANVQTAAPKLTSR